jgi:hypothetical protein
MPQSSRARAWAEPLAFIAVTSAVLLAIFPRGFPNYDTIYYLLWGRELAQGMSPDYGAPLAPTPHPLYHLFGAVLSPLGDGAITVAIVFAYISLGLLAWLIYRLGAEWLSRPIGAVAAFLVMTSAPVLSNGLRAYIDIPYMVFVLAALLIETRRPRSGWPVLVLLALAGLLRPEAWLFAGFYFLYLALDFHLRPKDGVGEAAPHPERRPGVNLGRLRIQLRQSGIDRNLVLMACLAAAGPVIWVLFDLLTTGNAFYSFTGTRETVETLERDTGPVDVILYGPRRLGEVMQWPAMVGALLGILLCLKTMPRRVMLGLIAAIAALIAFAIMGAAGLAIIPRYTMLAASILFIFAAASVLGWLLLEPGDRWRRPWQIAAVLVVALYIVWLPNQYDLLSKVDRDLTNQSLVERDLEALVDDGAFLVLEIDADSPDACLPISVPNHRAVPRLAFWLDIRPSDVVSVAATDEQPREGYFLAPARDFTVENFILDPGEPGRAVTRPPPGFELIAENRSWRLYSTCGSFTGYAPLSEP